MTDRRRLARLLMPGWRGGSAARLRRLVGDCPPAGLLVFSHGSLAKTRGFIRGLPPDLLVALDVEEGLGERFPESPRFPSARAAGVSGDVRLAHRMGRAIGLEARAFGVHWAFAPVVDVNADPENPIINVRSFGEDAAEVGRLGAAFVRGCQSAGVLACAKHFPGHGATRTDSHTRLPVVTVTQEEAWKRELLPFREAVRAGVASVMTAHVAFPAFDGKTPATLSRRLVTEVLRCELGFKGLVVTDSLSMGAIAGSYDGGEAGLQALLAGCDILLDPPDPEALLDRLEEASRSGELPRETVAAALERQREARDLLRVSLPHPDPAGYARRARREIAKRSVEVLRGRIPPASAGKPGRVVVLDDGAAPGAVGHFRKRMRGRRLPFAVVAVFSRVRVSKDRIRVPRAEIRKAVRQAKGAGQVVALLFGSHYVKKDLPKDWTVVATYSDAPDSIAAGVSRLTGSG